MTLQKGITPNRVRDSKARLILTYGGEGYISLDEVEAELDALIVAVREDALRRVREEVKGMLLVPVREGDELCNAIESAKLREVLALINKEIKSDA